MFNLAHRQASLVKKEMIIPTVKIISFYGVELKFYVNTLLVNSE